MQKILPFYILKHLLPQSADRQTGFIAGKLSGSTNNEKCGNDRMITSFYQHFADYSLNEFRSVVYLKWSERIEKMFYHSPFAFTNQHYVQNKNLNYLLLYCANIRTPQGEGYTN